MVWRGFRFTGPVNRRGGGARVGACILAGLAWVCFPLPARGSDISGASGAPKPAPAANAPVQAAAPGQPGTPAPATRPADAQAALENELAARLTNAVLVGSFTDGGKAPKQDKYTITSARKLLGDTWLLNARIQYGQKDVTVPLMVPIKWAGDTPVISVTDFGIPGLGTYTARVLIYRDHYAGFWQGKDHGGHMWGTIEKAPAEKAPAEKAEPKGEAKER